MTTRSSLPLVLSVNAGFVDTAGFLALHGLFTAHVTGNFVTIGASLVTGTSGIITKLLALPMFCLVIVLVRQLHYWLVEKMADRTDAPADQAVAAHFCRGLRGSLRALRAQRHALWRRYRPFPCCRHVDSERLASRAYGNHATVDHDDRDHDADHAGCGRLVAQTGAWRKSRCWAQACADAAGSLCLRDRLRRWGMQLCGLVDVVFCDTADDCAGRLFLRDPSLDVSPAK